MDNDTIASAKFTSDAALILTASNIPSLAALYLSQARSLHAPSPLHCPRCAHPSVSTRVVANSKQRTRRSKRKTKNVEDDNNKAQLSPIWKVEPSPSLTAPLPRVPRVRVIKRCGVCSYVAAVASDSRSHFYEKNNERLLNENPVTPSMVQDDDVASSSVIESRVPTPEVGKETDSQCITTIQSSQGSKGKQSIQASGQPAATGEAAPVAQAKSSLASAPTSIVSLPQSRSAIKRQKKRAGLQEMLARSKEQRQNSSFSSSGQDGGLSAFLSGL